MVLLSAVLALSTAPSDVGAQQQPPQTPWSPWILPGIPNPFPVPLPGSAAPASPFPIPIPPVAAPAAAPVVLELFTNKDCSACESAEYTMKRLADQPVAGATLIRIAYHVSFVEGAGTDPYVLQAATQRQQSYDAARGRTYTPQAIVDGDREFVGSEDETARAAIAAAARQPKVSVDVTRSARFVGPGALAISIRYGSMGARRAGLTLVLTEKGLLDIHHGGLIEYDRRPLAPIVRSMQELGVASPGGGATEATVTLPAGTVRANLTAVVLLSDTTNHHILGAGAVEAGIL